MFYVIRMHYSGLTRSLVSCSCVTRKTSIACAPWRKCMLHDAHYLLKCTFVFKLWLIFESEMLHWYKSITRGWKTLQTSTCSSLLNDYTSLKKHYGVLGLRLARFPSTKSMQTPLIARFASLSVC